MPLHRGDIYACTNDACGAELTVTRGVRADGGGDFEPLCSCGQKMSLQIERSERV
jgi:hypothetical protein